MCGCKFLILGDFAGQLLPITAQTDEFDYEQVADSDFMHDLCNGLRIDLTEYRRGSDMRHFHFMVDLYNPALHIKDAIAAAKERYPRTDAEPQYALVIAHRTRMDINTLTNERL